MSGPHIHRIQQADHIDRLIAFVASSGHEHLATLLREVRKGRICVAQVERTSPAPIGLLKREQRPACVLIGDDDGFSCGPSDWRSAPKLIAWACGALVHVTGGDAASYRAATRAHRRLPTGITIRNGQPIRTDGPTWHHDQCRRRGYRSE